MNKWKYDTCALKCKQQYWNKQNHISAKLYYDFMFIKGTGSLEPTPGARAKCGLQHYLDDSGCNGHKAPRSRHGFVFQA